MGLAHRLPEWTTVDTGALTVPEHLESLALTQHTPIQGPHSSFEAPEASCVSTTSATLGPQEGEGEQGQKKESRWLSLRLHCSLTKGSGPSQDGYTRLQAPTNLGLQLLRSMAHVTGS